MAFTITSTFVEDPAAVNFDIGAKFFEMAQKAVLAGAVSEDKTITKSGDTYLISRTSPTQQDAEEWAQSVRDFFAKYPDYTGFASVEVKEVTE